MANCISKIYDWMNRLNAWSPETYRRVNESEENSADPEEIIFHGVKYPLDENAYCFFYNPATGDVLWGEATTHRVSMEYMLEDYCFENIPGWKTMSWSERDDMIEKLFKERYPGYINCRYFCDVPAVTFWKELSYEQAMKAAEDMVKAIGKDEYVKRYGNHTVDEMYVQFHGKLIPYKGQADKKQSQTDNLEQRYNIHLANQDDKRKAMGNYLSDRSANMANRRMMNGKELSQAEYYALTHPYTESRKRR